MKKYLVMVMILAIIFSLESCKTNTGLSVTRKGNDLLIKGMSTLSKYDDKKKVVGTDSLATNSIPRINKANLVKIKNKKDQYLWKDGAKTPMELVISQPKEGTNLASDYNFAFKAIPVPKSLNYKIETLIDGSYIASGVGQTVAKPAKKKGSYDYNDGEDEGGDDTYYAGEEDYSGNNGKTFDMDGTKVKAVIEDQMSVVDYQPCLISFKLVPDKPVKLKQYSFNNKDFKIYNFETFERHGDKIYSKRINLLYGDRFILLNDDGKTPNISPESKDITLDGVELVRSPIDREQGYVFKVINGHSGAKRDNSRATMTDKSLNDGVSSSDLNSRGLKYGMARKFNPKNYPNGYYRVNIEDVAKDYWDLYLELSRRDKNGEAAIGWDDDGGLYPTVILSPGLAKQYPNIYNKYKNDLQMP